MCCSRARSPYDSYEFSLCIHRYLQDKIYNKYINARILFQINYCYGIEHYSKKNHELSYMHDIINLNVFYRMCSITQQIQYQTQYVRLLLIIFTVCYTILKLITFAYNSTSLKSHITCAFKGANGVCTRCLAMAYMSASLAFVDIQKSYNICNMLYLRFITDV